MGWEAIEQYLNEVEQEATNSLDQQVPSLQESVNTLAPQENNMNSFLVDDLPFTGPRPTYVHSTGGSPLRKEEEPSYCDLDQDRPFYHSEEDYKYAPKSNSSPVLNYCDNFEIQGQIKEEVFSDYSYQCNNYHIPSEEQSDGLDIKSKLLYECAEDVQTTCKCLCLHPDPMYWSCQNVQDWTQWQCQQFNVRIPNLDYFYILGSEICQWTEREFELYAPEAGQTLFSRLDIWRLVVEQTTNNGWADNSPKLTQIPVPTSPSLPMSPDRISPTPSNWSDDNMADSQSAFKAAFNIDSQADKDRLPEEPMHHHRQTIQLWQFLKLLLIDPSGNYKDCIRWVDRARGIFKIENSSRVAKLWGKRKNRPAMNYDKLSRSIRQYYRKGIIKKTEHAKRLVYQFCQP